MLLEEREKERATFHMRPAERIETQLGHELTLKLIFVQRKKCSQCVKMFFREYFDVRNHSLLDDGAADDILNLRL